MWQQPLLAIAMPATSWLKTTFARLSRYVYRYTIPLGVNDNRRTNLFTPCDATVASSCDCGNYGCVVLGGAGAKDGRFCTESAANSLCILWNSWYVKWPACQPIRKPEVVNVAVTLKSLAQQNASSRSQWLMDWATKKEKSKVCEILLIKMLTSTELAVMEIQNFTKQQDYYSILRLKWWSTRIGRGWWECYQYKGTGTVQQK